MCAVNGNYCLGIGYDGVEDPARSRIYQNHKRWRPVGVNSKIDGARNDGDTAMIFALDDTDHGFRYILVILKVYGKHQTRANLGSTNHR